eukprot:8899064-Pyramimonas_sp.AAC.1
MVARVAPRSESRLVAGLALFKDWLGKSPDLGMTVITVFLQLAGAGAFGLRLVLYSYSRDV